MNDSTPKVLPKRSYKNTLYTVVKLKSGWAVQNTNTFTIVFTSVIELQAVKVAATLNGLD